MMHLHVTMRGGKERDLALPLTFWLTTNNQPKKIHCAESEVIPRIMTKDVCGISDSFRFSIPITAIDMVELVDDEPDTEKKISDGLDRKNLGRNPKK
jgi:hypothetical protein